MLSDTQKLVRHLDIFSFMDDAEWSKPKRLTIHFSTVAGSGVKPPAFVISRGMEIKEMPRIYALRINLRSGQELFVL